MPKDVNGMDLLELELKMVVTGHIWVLKTELWSSGKGVSTCNTEPPLPDNILKILSFDNILGPPKRLSRDNTMSQIKYLG